MFSSFLALAVSPLLINVQTGALACTSRKYDNTIIEVNVHHDPVIIKREKTLHDLNWEFGSKVNKRKQEANQEYYLNDELQTNDDWTIGGTSHGDVKTNTDIEFLDIKQGAKKEYSCLLYKSVRVNVSYQTSMTIAKDFSEDGCAYNAVLAHEKTRHDGYTRIVDMVAERLREDLPKAIDGYEMGYVPSNKIKGGLKDMRAYIEDMVTKYQNHMMKLMDEYNDVVDSPEGLKILASTCVHERMKELKEQSEHHKAKEEKPIEPGSLGSYLKEFRKKEE